MFDHYLTLQFDLRYVPLLFRAGHKIVAGFLISVLIVEPSSTPKYDRENILSENAMP